MRQFLVQMASPVALATALMATPAFGQAAPDSVASGDEELPLTAASEAGDGDIVVTATRRETTLLTTPAAVSAVTGEELASKGIVNATGFDNLVPNLKINDQSGQGAGALQISIRGIGNSSFIEIGDPNVALHVDGVYTSRPQAAFNLLFDAQRLEVARGPQGTLYGRNATVGSINIINNRPHPTEVSADVAVSYGRFDERSVGGVVNIPIIRDVLAVRAAALWRKRDTQYDLRDDDIARAQFLSRFNFDLDQSPYRQRYGNGLDKSSGAGSIDQFSWRVSGRLTPLEGLEAYVSYERFDNNSPFSPLTTHDAPYTAWLSTPHHLDQTIETVRGEVKYNVGGAVEIKGVFGDQNYFHENLFDLDGGSYRFSPEFTNPLGAGGNGNPFFGGDSLEFEQTFYDRAWKTRSRSYELVATSTYDSPLQWIAGYYRFKENTYRDFWVDLPFTSDGLINFNQPDREATSDAFFGRLEYAVTDRIKFTGGLRQTSDTRTDTGVNRFDRFPGNGDFGGYGVPFLVDQAGLTDLEFLCSRGPQVGPCAGINSTYSGAAINLGNNPGAPIPGLTQGFAAAPGSPLAQVQAAIVGLTAPNAKVFNAAITTDAQLRDISSLLSAGEQVALVGNAAAFPRVFFTTQDFKYTDWSATASWTPVDGTFLYGTVSTGHKAGSEEIFYQPRLGQFINSILKPERVVNYEAGIKQRFGAGRNIALTGFYMDYKNKQQSVFVDGGDLFCAQTFGDFNGDGYIEDFVKNLGGVGIFSQSAALLNGAFGGATQDGPPGVDGQPGWRPNDIAQIASLCAAGSTSSRGALADSPGVPNFVELLQINFGNAKIAGLELEYNWKFGESTRLSGYTTLNVINKFDNANTDALPFNLNDSLNCGDRVGGCPTIATVNGNELPFAPDVTVRAQLEHDFRIDKVGTFTPRVGVTYNGSYWLSIFNVDCYDSVRLGRQVCNEGDKVKSYATVDLNLRYTNPSEKFWAELYGTNVTGTTYETNIVRPTSADNKSLYSFNERATYGLRLGAKF